MRELKTIGRFAYQYSDEGNLCIADIKDLSTLSGLNNILNVLKKYKNNFKQYCKLKYEDHIFIGMEFVNIPETEVVEILEDEALKNPVE